MRKSICVQWFRNILTEVSAGRGRWPQTNPAKDFVRDAKLGQFDSLSDDAYGALLSETEELSTFWQMAQSKSSFELLQAALEKIELPADQAAALAEILAECYAASVTAFTPEDAIPQVCQEDEGEEDWLQEFTDDDWEQSFVQNLQDAAKAVKQASPAPEPEPPAVKKSAASRPKPATPDQMTPQQIYAFLAARIYGQEEAVKAAAMLLYNHLHHRKRNLLMAGPTGCGKTEIWRAAQQLYPSIRIVDSTAITMEGWSGSFKIRDIFTDMSPSEIQQCIVVFDEFDKFCEPRVGSGGSDFSAAGQNELLKLIEGGRILYPEDKGKPALDFDSSSISFVFCGSFERLTEAKAQGLAPRSIGFGNPVEAPSSYDQYQLAISPEDLVQYAHIRLEIAGRIGQVVQLAPMRAQDFDHILEDTALSPLHQLEQQYGVRLHLDSQTRQQLIREAEENHMGVRYLRNRLQQLLDDQIFLHWDQSEYQLEA